MELPALMPSAADSGLALEWLIAIGVAVLGGLAVASQRSRLPYPIFLVLAGLALGFMPGVPEMRLDPDLVFVLFLPPLIYAAAYFTSLREFTAAIRPISLLAVGLVLFTTVTVAVVAHTVIDGMGWAVAFTLGAIVSPTDPVAGTAVLERLRVPRRVMHIVEGESLINDGSGIVLYRVAVAAVVTGSFSAMDAGLEFVVSCVGGIAIGAAAGMVVAFTRRRNTHGPTDVLLSLLASYVAYLPAEALHVSGVLAAATTGIYLGWRTPTIVRDPETRLQINGVWVNVTFVINTVLFLFVGMQMRWILERIDDIGAGRLVGYALAIGLTVMATRLVWVFPASHIPRWLSPRIRARERNPGWRGPLLVGWIGMRGAVSLAAALALPATIDGGAPFPQRDLVIFLAFSVIVITLVVQGVTLPRVVAWLALEDSGEVARAEAHARMVAAKAAMTKLDELADADWTHQRSIENLRNLHEYRHRRYESRVLRTEEAEMYDDRAEAWLRLSRHVHEAQLAAILALRDDGTITDEVMELVQRDLDLEGARFGHHRGE